MALDTAPIRKNPAPTMAVRSRHPVRETRYQCLKIDLCLGEQCLGCRDPQLTCKHRPAGPIWFIDTRRRRRPRDTAIPAGGLKPLPPAACV
jgi:hypothetical protein